jgi:TonB family protein
LKQLVNILMKAAKENDQKTLAAYAESLKLPDAQAWLKAVFGDELGQDVAEAYAGMSTNLQAALSESLSTLLKPDVPEIQVLRFKEPCEPATSQELHAILLLRRKPVPFYLPLFTNRKQPASRTLGFFAFVDGAFRFLGVIRLKPHLSVGIPVDQKIQQAKLKSIVRPVYPQVAKDKRLQGTVQLEAVIGEDGTIHDVRVLSGPCILSQSALQAVQGWRYEPTLVDGKPVPIRTTIDVVFSIYR